MKSSERCQMGWVQVSVMGIFRLGRLATKESRPLGFENFAAGFFGDAIEQRAIRGEGAEFFGIGLDSPAQFAGADFRGVGGFDAGCRGVFSCGCVRRRSRHIDRALVVLASAVRFEGAVVGGVNFDGNNRVVERLELFVAGGDDDLAILAGCVAGDHFDIDRFGNIGNEPAGGLSPRFGEIILLRIRSSQRPAPEVADEQ